LAHDLVGLEDFQAARQTDSPSRRLAVRADRRIKAGLGRESGPLRLRGISLIPKPSDEVGQRITKVPAVEVNAGDGSSTASEYSNPSIALSG